MTTNTNNKPAATIRDGAIKATIWKNKGEKGDFHSIRFTRTWKDDKGNYQDSDNFTGAELLRVAYLATKAYEHLASLRQSQGGPDPDPESEE